MNSSETASIVSRSNVLAVVSSHSAAAWLSHRRLGRVACVVLIFLSALFTAFWFWAMQLPFFSIAGAIK